MELAECANYLNKILRECVDDCIALDNENKNLPTCAMSIQKAKELSERMIMLIKRWEFEDRF